MKTLNTLQTLSKIAKILSRIAFVCATVATCICVVGLICTAFGGGEVFKIGGVTVYGLLKVDSEEGLKLVSTALSGALITSIGMAVLAYFAEKCFANELKAGTPFTQEWAKELMRLGILIIVVPTACVVAAEIVQGIVAGVLDASKENMLDIRFDNEGSIVTGVAMIVMSLLCRYGAECSCTEIQK